MRNLNQAFFTDGESEGLDFCKKSKLTNSHFRSLSDIEEVIVHCTATPPESYKNWDNPMTLINYDLRPNHISRTGLGTATYHFYVSRAGELFQLVSMGLRTAHCLNHNQHSVAICINHDGFTNDVPEHGEQFKALIEGICYIFDKLDWSYDLESVSDRIAFHRDYSPKACPGRIEKQAVVSAVHEMLKTWGDNN